MECEKVKCCSCGYEVEKTFNFKGYDYCSDCQLEAECEEIEKVDYMEW